MRNSNSRSKARTAGGPSDLGFGHSGGMAERVGDAFSERRAEFHRLGRMPGDEETLFGPDLPPHRGEGVGEGRAPLAVPSRGRDPQALVVAEAGGEQGHDGEQREQAGRGARDRLVRPLALCLDAEVVATSRKVTSSCQRWTNQPMICSGSRAGSVQSSACGSKRPQGSRSSTQRIGTTGKPAWRQTAVSERISTMRSPSPYQPGTATRRQGVSLSARTLARVGRRAPLVRGRPTAPGRRGGTG